MKKLIILSTIIFSVMVSSPSFADWTKVGKSVDGGTFYVDFERIRKHGGDVYWWELVDFMKPDKMGDLSVKNYRQGDCKLFRFKQLSFLGYKEQMGQGTQKTYFLLGWRYPSPNSVNEIILQRVCAYAK
jgi:hypothetical protein